METVLSLTGNEAVAYAMKQINPDVVAAYPITPQTEIMHAFTEYVANGVVKTELILVESEHSALSACVGAASAGARTMTATSAQGLALMWEVLYIAAGLRLPIVMANVNRALSAPINIHCDHSDSMGARDSGWIQLYCENCQEVYDNVIQAVRIGEHKDVRLPVMVCLDGFILSHTNERVEVLPDEIVSQFIGEYQPDCSILDIHHPITLGALDLQDYYFEHHRQKAEGMRNAEKVILSVGEEYGKISGRSYGYFEKYYTDDADVVIVALGSTAGTAKAVVNELRKQGIKAGVLKLRVFRPFPAADLASALAKAKVIGVLDRSDTVSGKNGGGPVFTEIRSALYGISQAPIIVDYIYGLGGRDIFPEDIIKVYKELQNIAESQKVEQLVTYLGVRE